MSFLQKIPAVMSPYTTRTWGSFESVVILAIVSVWSGFMFFVSIPLFLYKLCKAHFWGSSEVQFSPPKNIFITGGGSGLGEYLAYYYACHGASNIFLCDINDTRQKSVAEAVRALNPDINVVSFVASVVDASAIREVVEKADDIAPLDLIIANAGVASNTLPSTFSEEEVFRTVYNVNLMGVVNTVFPAIDRFKLRAKGQVAIVASMAGLAYFNTVKPYCSSKHAAMTFGLGLREEYRGSGIGVTTLCPGFIRTRITQKGIDKNGSLPFLWEVEPAVEVMAKAIGNNIGLVAFPLPMTLVSYLVRILPPQMQEFIAKISNKTIQQDQIGNLAKMD